MLQGRQMAPIQLDSITMLVKKCWLGTPGRYPVRYWEGEIFKLTTSSILYEKNLLFVMGEAFVYITLWYTNTTPASFYVGSPRC